MSNEDRRSSGKFAIDSVAIPHKSGDSDEDDFDTVDAGSVERDGEGADVVTEMLSPSKLAVSPRKSRKFQDVLGASTTFDWGEGTSGIVNTADFKTQILDDHRFTGKTVVITGAGGQLGREGCIFFAKRGARIAAMDRSKEGLKETFDILNAGRQSGVLTFDFRPYVCDVTNAEQILEVVDSIAHRCGQIDYLWNNAGYQGKIKPLLDMDPEDYKMTMDINCVGMFIVLQAVSRKMVELGTEGCSIVNTSSVAGQRGTPCMSGYAASKAAVLSLTVNGAKELAQFGIRVNAVSPALIGPGFLWERQNKLHAKIGPPFFASNDPDDVGQSKINQVPMKRLGTPEEVVNTVSFLFSSDASYITGSNINVDGGMAASLRA